MPGGFWATLTRVAVPLLALLRRVAVPLLMLDRNFKTDAPDKVWVTDLTYIRTRQGWLYLSAILDLYSR